MSKGKRARFHLKSGERIIKHGLMDYCMMGKYRHFVAGDAVLTDTRFYFGAELETGEYLSFEFPLSEIESVERTGIPLFTRSILIVSGGRSYRLNSFVSGSWIKALKAALEATKAQ